MLIIFESILPIFLIVLFGAALKRAPVFEQSLWDGLEMFGYYVLFPALLFLTLARADFSAMATGAVTGVTIIAVLVMSLLVLALWPFARRSGVSGPSFTTIFQTSTRWNGFMALAIAEKLAGTTGLTIVAIVMASVIIPINFLNVGVLVWFSGGRRDFGGFARRIAQNPIILGSAAGVLANASGVTIYEPLMVGIDLVARSSLGLGLIMVGAGLRIADALKPHPTALGAVVLKLMVFPALMMALGLAFGLTGEVLVMLALSAGVPTAMNGYLLAKQMGGDAPLYAAIATIQTGAAFFTIPAVLFVAGYIAAG